MGGTQRPVPAAQNHFSWHSPSRTQCQRSLQPSHVATAGFAPSRKHKAPFPPSRSLQSPALSWAGAQLRALRFAPAQTGAVPGKARPKPLNLDPSLLCQGGDKVWAVTVFFTDQKSKKDENNLRWALDSFSPASNTWGTRTCHPSWHQATKQPRLGSCSSTPKGFLPAEAHEGTWSAVIYLPSAHPLPRAPPDPLPGVS